MANLLFSVHGRISRRPFWLVYLVLLPISLALILFIEASVNNNSILMLMAWFFMPGLQFVSQSSGSTIWMRRGGFRSLSF